MPLVFRPALYLPIDRQEKHEFRFNNFFYAGITKLIEALDGFGSSFTLTLFQG